MLSRPMASFSYAATNNVEDLLPDYLVWNIMIGEKSFFATDNQFSKKETC